MNLRLFAIATTCMVVGAAVRAQTNAPAGGDALPNPLGDVEDAIGRIRSSYEEIRLRFVEKDRLLRQAISAQQAAEAQCRVVETRLGEAEADRKDLRDRNRRIESELSKAQETIAGLLRTVTNLEDQVASAQRDARKASQEKNDILATADKARERMADAEKDRDRARDALLALEARLKSLITGSAPPPEPARTPVKEPEPAITVEAPPVPPKPEPVKPSPAPPTPPDVPTEKPALQLAPKPVPELPAAMVGRPSDEPAENRKSTTAPPIPEPILTNAPPAEMVAPAPPLVPATRTEAAPAADRERPEAIDRILADASAAFDGGDWDRARSLYEKVLADSPSDPVASVGLTEVLMQTGETGRALDKARQLLDADPASPRRLFLAGRAAARDGRSEEALGLLERAMKGSPDNPDVKRELAAVLFDLRKYRESADMFVATTRLDAADGESWFNACAALLMTDPSPLKEASRYYEKALSLGEPRDERIEKRFRPALSTPARMSPAKN